MYDRFETEHKYNWILKQMKSVQLLHESQRRSCTRRGYDCVGMGDSVLCILHLCIHSMLS